MLLRACFCMFYVLKKSKLDILIRPGFSNPDLGLARCILNCVFSLESKMSSWFFQHFSVDHQHFLMGYAWPEETIGLFAIFVWSPKWKGSFQATHNVRWIQPQFFWHKPQLFAHYCGKPIKQTLLWNLKTGAGSAKNTTAVQFVGVVITNLNCSGVYLINIIGHELDAKLKGTEVVIDRKPLIEMVLRPTQFCFVKKTILYSLVGDELNFS